VPEKRQTRGAIKGERYDAAASPSMIFAVSFDHSCSPPQCGQPILPTNEGSLAKDDFSISIPVSIRRPVTAHGVNIFDIPAVPLSRPDGTLWDGSGALH
jgi:hypothetical protein